MLKIGDAAVQVRPLGIVDEALAGETDPDEDPDHESDEDGRQRRDVVAEVEHRRESVGADGKLVPGFSRLHRLEPERVADRAPERLDHVSERRRDEHGDDDGA